jgi:hypothetical protein
MASVNPVDFLSVFESAGLAKVSTEIAINGLDRTSRMLYRAVTPLDLELVALDEAHRDCVEVSR